MSRLPGICATVAVNFSKERFRKQDWFDKRSEPWPKRKNNGKRPSDRRAILVKSGRLRRSIRKVSQTSSSVTIGTDVPYAKAHNYGSETEGVETVRSYTRRAHSRKSHIRNGRKIKRASVKEALISSFSRRFKRKLPKRQFLGKSDALNKELSRHIQETYKKAVISSCQDIQIT